MSVGWVGWVDEKGNVLIFRIKKFINFTKRLVIYYYMDGGRENVKWRGGGGWYITTWGISKI